MPTILRRDGIRFVIYSNDHTPEHVRAVGADFELVFDLNCPNGPVELRNRYNRDRYGDVLAIVEAELVTLCQAWRQIHG